MPAVDYAAVAQALTAVADVLAALARALTAAAGPTTAAPLNVAPASFGANGGMTAPGATAPASAPATFTPAPASSTAAAPAPGTQARGGGSSTAKVATFNVLGASHTSSGGNKPQYRSGADRVPDMVAQLRKHDVGIAGIQEFQESQQRAFRAANTGYEMAGDRDNAVIWKADRYRKVDETSVTIPYFKGKPRKMPAVQLEDRTTGARVWVLSVHNPADTKSNPGNAGNRAESIRRERAFIQQLEATGIPVIVAGDFNDDKVARSAMEQGGLTHVADPSGSARNIDWVFGTSGVRFGATTRDTSPREDQTSDHPIVVTTATF
jgi:hypothetical protein